MRCVIFSEEGVTYLLSFSGLNELEIFIKEQEINNNSITLHPPVSKSSSGVRNNNWCVELSHTYADDYLETPPSYFKS
jgi:hypothetical protein